MSDDRRKLKLDRRRINLGQPYESTYWTRALGVTRRQLRAAVDAVGVEVTKVRAYVRLWRGVSNAVKPTWAITALADATAKPARKKKAAKK